ncbi:hypothetical protein, partial [Staphylococcus aureus]|uniref:hypothetical protein n=1 Tax=Staphylococcus aureus TaxID=1280 RepID=UPI003D0EF4E9
IGGVGVLLAFLVRIALFVPLGDRAVFVFFIPPILVVAMIGGFLAATVTAALSAIAVYALKEWTTLHGAIFSEMVVIVVVGVAIAL